jgi:Domain of unknown function (DUF3291)
VADDHRPDWRKAIARFELLHDRGPTTDALNFKSPFDAMGSPTVVDKEAVRLLAIARST